MIIDFHTHVLAPEHQAQFTTSKFHSQVLAASSRGRRPPHTIENVLEAAKIGAAALPSTVTISAPSACTANMMHERAASPLYRIVLQKPHCSP